MWCQCCHYFQVRGHGPTVHAWQCKVLKPSAQRQHQNTLCEGAAMDGPTRVSGPLTWLAHNHVGSHTGLCLHASLGDFSRRWSCHTSCDIRSERQPPWGWAVSGCQSLGECQRTKSASWQVELAALKAAMSAWRRPPPCKRALVACSNVESSAVPYPYIV